MSFFPLCSFPAQPLISLRTGPRRDGFQGQDSKHSSPVLEKLSLPRDSSQAQGGAAGGGVESQERSVSSAGLGVRANARNPQAGCLPRNSEGKGCPSHSPLDKGWSVVPHYAPPPTNIHVHTYARTPHQVIHNVNKSSRSSCAKGTDPDSPLSPVWPDPDDSLWTPASHTTLYFDPQRKRVTVFTCCAHSWF